MKLKSLVACLSAAGVSSVLAQDNILLATAYDAQMGDEVVVTATRSPQVLKDALSSTTVITRKQIEQSNSQDLYQLLRTVPGVHVRRAGGPGSTTTLSMRGGNSNATLVLVDGMNIESATTGDAALENITIDQIERIEIVRGPKSSAYGASAMSGVVQIFTRKSAGKDGVTYTLGGGSNATRKGVVSASGVSETNRFNITASHINSEGYDLLNADDANASSPVYGKDHDGYRRSAVSLFVEQDLGQYIAADFVLNRMEGETEYDNAYNSDTFPQQKLANLLASTALKFETDRYQSRLQYSHYTDESEHQNISYENHFDTLRQKGVWENSVSLSEMMVLNFGADYTHDEVESADDYTQSRRDNFGGYSNLQTNLEPVFWSLGLRHDNNDQFGSKWTGDTALGFEVLQGVELSVSYGTAFRAPTFNELYFPDTPFVGRGDPSLAPESTESYEAGIDVRQDWGASSLHVYKSTVEDYIEWSETSLYFSEPFNVGEVKIEGAELMFGMEFFGLGFATSYVYEKVTDEATGENIQFKPRRRLTLDVDKTLGQFSVGASFYTQSEQYQNQYNAPQLRLSGYGQLDVRAAWQVNKEVKLSTRVSNILDQEYVPQKGYNNEGRVAMLYVDFTPQ